MACFVVFSVFLLFAAVVYAQSAAGGAGGAGSSGVPLSAEKLNELPKTAATNVSSSGRDASTGAGSVSNSSRQPQEKLAGTVQQANNTVKPSGAAEAGVASTPATSYSDEVLPGSNQANSSSVSPKAGNLQKSVQEKASENLEKPRQSIFVAVKNFFRRLFG